MRKKSMAVLLSLLLCFCGIPSQALGLVKNAGTPVEASSLVSSNGMEHNFVKVTAMGSTLEIEVETPVKAAEYNFNLVKVGSTTREWAGRAYPMDMGEYNQFSFTLTNTGSKIGRSLSGDYILMITKKVGAKNNPVIYKNCCFRVTNGQFSVLNYEKIQAENQAKDKKANKTALKNFTKTNLSDLKTLLFKDPVTKKTASVTTKKVKYFKTVSNAVVKGADTDYEKLLKIYEYVAENFYYDNIAFATKTRQYVDPYRNLYNLRNKKKSENSENGKVASTCVGYAAAVTALARAQGIPTRIVNGHHVSLGDDGGFNNWTTEKNITTLDHWWTECYVDGRWITVDPTPGNSNKWNRSTNVWTYTGLTNYVYFDPTPEQLATSHVILEIRGSK